jgi:hypothetical protein
LREAERASLFLLKNFLKMKGESYFLSPPTPEVLEMSDLILLQTKLCSTALFTDFEQVPGFKAQSEDEAIGYPMHGIELPNLAIWDWVTKEAIRAIKHLVGEDLLEANACSPWLYYFDGNGLPLPIATKVMNYKRPRWYPMSFKLTDKGKAYCRDKNLRKLSSKLMGRPLGAK